MLVIIFIRVTATVREVIQLFLSLIIKFSSLSISTYFPFFLAISYFFFAVVAVYIGVGITDSLLLSLLLRFDSYSF